MKIQDDEESYASELLLKSRGRTYDVFCKKEENRGMASSQSNSQLALSRN